MDSITIFTVFFLGVATTINGVLIFVIIRRFENLETRVGQLDWQTERLLMWYMNERTVGGISQDSIDEVMSKLKEEG